MITDNLAVAVNDSEKYWNHKIRTESRSVRIRFRRDKGECVGEENDGDNNSKRNNGSDD